MPIAFVQSVSTDDAGALSSGSLAFTSDNTVKNLIVVGVRAGTGSSSGTVTISDSNSNTYTQVYVVNTSGHAARVFYAQGISSGPNTVSFVFSSAVNMRWALHEYSGFSTSGSLDKQASTQVTVSSSSPLSPAVTTAQASELLFGWGTSAAANTWTAGTNYTIRESVNMSGRAMSEDRIVSVTGSYTASAAITASVWSMGIVTFSTGAASGVSVVTPRSLALLGVGS